MVKEYPNRTRKQNKSMHKYFELLAEALNDAGYDMKKVLKPEIDIPWTKESVKSHLWKPIQEAMFDKEHTSDTDTVEPSAVYETLNRHTSEKLGVSVPWPQKKYPDDNMEW